MQTQFTPVCLHVAPITKPVENVDKGQGSNLLNVLLERFSPGARCEGWSTFLPRVTNQSQPVIFYWLEGLTRNENGIPPFVLLDAEWSLVEPIRHFLSPDVA